MRIGVIAADFPPSRGGMQEHARGVVTWLAERHPVTLATLPGHGVECPDLTVIDRLSSIPKRDAALIDGLEADVWLALSAGSTVIAPMIRKPLFGYVHGVDALNPWVPYRSGPRDFAVAALRRLGVIERDFAHDPIRRRIERGFKAARGMFANSRATAELVARFYAVRADDFTVVAPGVDDAFLEPRPRFPAPHLRLLTISRLSSGARRKNVEGAIRAAALLAREMPLSFEIVGSGDDLERLKGVAAESGLGGAIRFQGDVDEDGIKDAYARADLFVLATESTVKDVEGFGMVYAEAACAGVPVIAARNGGVAEAVADGVSGILIDDGSVESIAAAIRRFVASRGSFDVDRIRAHGRSLSYPVTTRRLYEAMMARLS